MYTLNIVRPFLFYNSNSNFTQLIINICLRVYSVGFPETQGVVGVQDLTVLNAAHKDVYTTNQHQIPLQEHSNDQISDFTAGGSETDQDVNTDNNLQTVEEKGAITNDNGHAIQQNAREFESK